MQVQMMDISREEKLQQIFQTHQKFLSKVSNIFAYKSRGTIDQNEFYQEFAVRVIELHDRYQGKVDGEFSKILRFSLYNLGLDLMRIRFRNFYYDPQGPEYAAIFEREQVEKTFTPSFLYFYRESMIRMLSDTRTREIFLWLIDNPDLVEKVREEKNLTLQRARKMAYSDILTAVVQKFQLSGLESLKHLHNIKENLFVLFQMELAS